MENSLKLAMRHFARLHPQTDTLIRLSYLEGAAGAKPGTWTRKGRMGLAHARNHFGPGLHESWTKPGNSGLLNAAAGGALKILKGTEGTLDADTIVQSFIVGMSPLTGEKIKPVYWGLGEGREEELRSGRLRTSDLQSIIFSTTKFRTISTVRHLKKTLSTRDDEGQVRPEMEKGEASDALLLALRDKGNPVARKIRDRLKEIAMRAAQQPGKENTALTYVAYLDLLEDASSERGLAGELSRKLDTPPGTISKRLNFMQKFMVEVGRRDSKLKKLIAEVSAMDELAYGQRFASDSEKRVASLVRRFLTDQS